MLFTYNWSWNYLKWICTHLLFSLFNTLASLFTVHFRTDSSILCDDWFRTISLSSERYKRINGGEICKVGFLLLNKSVGVRKWSATSSLVIKLVFVWIKSAYKCQKCLLLLYKHRFPKSLKNFQWALKWEVIICVCSATWCQLRCRCKRYLKFKHEPISYYVLFSLIHSPILYCVYSHP